MVAPFTVNFEALHNEWIDGMCHAVHYHEAKEFWIGLVQDNKGNWYKVDLDTLRVMR